MKSAAVRFNPIFVKTTIISAPAMPFVSRDTLVLPPLSVHVIELETVPGRHEVKVLIAVNRTN